MPSTVYKPQLLILRTLVPVHLLSLGICAMSVGIMTDRSGAYAPRQWMVIVHALALLTTG